MRRAYVLAALAIGAIAIACSLNPQPLPPETSSGEDGGAGGDATAGTGDDGGNFARDASADTGQNDRDAAPMPPPGDGAVDGDATTDAEHDGEAGADAGDAAID